MNEIINGIIKEDENYLMQSFKRWYPFVISRGSGALVYDVQGKEYIDFNAGIGVLALGHANEKIINAVSQQMHKFFHYSLTDFYYELAIRVAKKLVSFMPYPAKVFYTNSGTESVEAAIKIARGNTGRQWIIGFMNSFHGRTMGSLAFTSSKSVQRKSFSPLLSSTYLIPYPDKRNPLCKEDCTDNLLSFIEDWLFKKIVDPSEIAAFIAEPIQGEGGVIVPPYDFFYKLNSILKKYGILLILDEVQTGIGRTGKMFAFEHFNVTPDMICIAKAIGGGIPLGAVVGRKEVMNLPAGSHANTFGGNPLALAAAEVVLDEVPRLLDHVSSLGKKIVEELKDTRSPYVYEVRGLGLLIGVELRKDNKPYVEGLEKVLYNTFLRGVLAIGAGESVVRIEPPLIIPEDLAIKGTKIMKEEIEKL
ncbi:4-aminobutyrate aminotransferase [Sulfolobus sp. A20]|uniref:acetyl ornithine aminotransferase family protein n=1 Tax=Sulfolobaceae TaxID=118883 RepID=UPI00084615FD|nr:MULTISPECIES: acetyl ornithine aminotransferase family protein [unclassified Sulfolobus]TRM75892.1 acetyl ornithine aminotransferase family protein [Sulfolobus sp. A20-N-F8]TRM75987.1 acetyl ornithine aminotransferase family protein [Sulfolobus sp. B5]TRM89736.1 acetyl ornithine aminotransferase family protein [Sulfolobus sp. C3]TRN01202.1 acetyl ornithine aminotransferase family protein [Sulfolobus sp. F1]TRN03482.1 acetyl ornithine aminotransferase family protein [Sulfolobus sp. E1]